MPKMFEMEKAVMKRIVDKTTSPIAIFEKPRFIKTAINETRESAAATKNQQPEARC